jgi:hypothetical protein
MPDNRISATLSSADQQAVLAAINTIREKLPFLIDLSPEDRRTLPRMGDSGRGFVTQALEVASQNTDILPRSFDVDEMRKDVELLNALSPILLALAQLNELVDDTFMEVGSEAYVAALRWPSTNTSAPPARARPSTARSTPSANVSHASRAASRRRPRRPPTSRKTRLFPPPRPDIPLPGREFAPRR